MVNGNTPKNLQELYEFYNYKNAWLPTLTPHQKLYPNEYTIPPEVYLNPLILLLSKKLNVSLYDILEYIQNRDDYNRRPEFQLDADTEISKYFNLDAAMGSCSATTKVFETINEKYLELEWTINEPINQLLNQNSPYHFKTFTSAQKEFPLANRYYLFESRQGYKGGWSYSPGIFILKYGEEQPLFLNWRESPF
jgi:hypothetical protein